MYDPDCGAGCGGGVGEELMRVAPLRTVKYILLTLAVIAFVTGHYVSVSVFAAAALSVSALQSAVTPLGSKWWWL